MTSRRSAARWKACWRMKAIRPCSPEAARSAWKSCGTNLPDVVLLDIWLPGIDGLETLEKLVEREDHPEVIMISGHGNIETAVRATKLGRLRFPGEAALHRTHADRPEERHRSQAAAQREPGIQEAVSGAQRHRGRQHSHQGAAPADLADGADQRPRADLRRIRHRQGTGGARDSRAEPAQGCHVRRGELRRHSRRPDRERTVRPSQGRILQRRPPTRKASFRRPTAERCSSMKSAT